LIEKIIESSTKISRKKKQKKPCDRQLIHEKMMKPIKTRILCYWKKGVPSPKIHWCSIKKKINNKNVYRLEERNLK